MYTLQPQKGWIENIQKSIQTHTPVLNAEDSISKRVATHKEHMSTCQQQKRWIENIKQSIQKHTPALNANGNTSKRIAETKETYKLFNGKRD